MIILIAFFATVQGHNWLNSPSRASHGALAETAKPTVSSFSGLPHVQVVAGQDFPIEFAQGHKSANVGHFHYFIVLNAKDSDAMKKHDFDLYEKYLAGCQGAENGPSTEPLFMYTYGDENTLDFQERCVPACPVIKNYWAREVKPGMTQYIERHPLFEGILDGAPKIPDNKLVHQMEFKRAMLSRDRICTHKSAAFPWIMEMRRYEVVKHRPKSPNVAMFRIPAGSAPGNYIVHWSWRGYYDAVDVLVVPGTTPVPFPYGSHTPSTGASFIRMDHCSFPGNVRVGACVPMTANPILNLPSQCIDACKALGASDCDGVAVVPTKHPNSVYSLFRSGPNAVPPNIAYGDGCAATEAPYVCYPLLARKPTDLDGPFLLTKDPEDPAFYSTCFTRIASSVEPPAPKRGDFSFGGRCISCKDREENVRPGVTPVWTMADSCVDCDIDSTMRLWLPLEGNADNIAPYGPQGITARGAVSYVPGRVGTAMHFPNDPSAFLDLGTESFANASTITIAMWVRFNDVSKSSSILTKGTGRLLQSRTLYMRAVAGKEGDVQGKMMLYVGMRVLPDATSLLHCYQPRSVLVDRSWTHIAVTYDGNRITGYVNGLECGNKQVQGGSMQASSAPLRIGLDDGADTPADEPRPFDGDIDDIRVYTKPFSNAEMKEFYASYA